IEDRVITIRTPMTYGYAIGQEQFVTVPPSLTPVDVRPAMQREPGTPPAGAQFAGRPLAGARLPRSRAWRRVDAAVHLHDPARLPTGGPRTRHVGATRLGWPVKTAHIRAAVPPRRSRLSAGRHVIGYLLRGDRRPLVATLGAM